VKRILRYLRGTVDYMLCYQGRYLRLRGYSDADWASNLNERKSTSGYTFLLGGRAITWCSKKQLCVALFTMKSKYVACFVAVQEAVWLRRFLQRLDIVAVLWIQSQSIVIAWLLLLTRRIRNIMEKPNTSRLSITTFETWLQRKKCS
jgi:hypothetical protein